MPHAAPDRLGPHLPPGSPRGRLLAIGWATAVAMWAIAYVAMMGPGLALGEVLVGLMALVLAGGGWLAGRTGGGWRAGALVGLIAGAVNLLLVGSLFGGKDTVSPAQAAGWVTVNFGVSLLFGAIGGAVGGRRPAARSEAHWPGVFATVTAAAAFLLLVTGGLVTGLRAGLAVPDWPNSFGHNMLLYPLSEMKGGVYYEHAHRLYGMLVGLSTIVLVVLLAMTERRRWVLGLAVATLLLVIAQGLMGGLRVTGSFTLAEVPETAPSTALAIAHGTFGQIVFALLVLLATATTRQWLLGPAPAALPSAGRDRTLTAVFVAAILVQLILGVTYRQHRTWHEPLAWALHGHLTFALVVIVLGVVVGVRALAYEGQPRIVRVGKAVLGILGLQVVLGIAALVAVLIWREGDLPVAGVIMTSAHQAVGALLLAHAVMLGAWERRLIAPAPVARTVTA